MLKQAQAFTAANSRIPCLRLWSMGAMLGLLYMTSSRIRALITSTDWSCCIKHRIHPKFPIIFFLIMHCSTSSFSFADSINVQNLGMEYFLGLGREKNVEKAKHLLLAAADEGDGTAMYNLSALFISVDDLSNAAYWMVNSLMAGDKFAFEQMSWYENNYSLEFRIAFKLRLKEIGHYDISTNGVFDKQVKKLIADLVLAGQKKQKK